MVKTKALAIFNAVALIIQLTVTYLVQTKAINQLNIGEVSDKYETLLTPADFTFGIWGVIYTLLIIMCLYHIVIAYKHEKYHPANKELLKMGSLFIVVNLASAGWLMAWVSERLLISVVLIVLQLLCLVAIHVRLKMYNTFKAAGLKVCNQFPLSIYLGWISIAVITNISSYLSSQQWTGLGLPATQWAIIMISIAVFLSTVMILIRRNIYFALVIAWGLYGIVVKRDNIDPDLYASIIITAWAGIGIILVLSLIQLIRNMYHKKPRETFPAAHFPLK